MCVDSVLGKKPQGGANYNKFLKSTLYSPARQYPLLGPEEKNKLKSLNPEPLLVGLLSENPLNLGSIQAHFQNLPKGSALSYQQRLTEQYIINDYGQTNFLDLPLTGAGDRFVNSLSICLESTKLAKLQTLTVTLDMACDLEHKTREQSESGLWHSLRQKRITASKFGIVVKRVGTLSIDDKMGRRCRPEVKFSRANLRGMR